MSNIGQNIKNRRIELGLTADQLADRLQKSRATIYRYESTDADNMPIGILEPLAKALSTTPAELMGWASPPPKVTTHLSFDSNSPEHDLYQYYIRRPEPVQKEIVKRLKDMDTTFAKNVSNLLQQSGDVNGFMQHTNLDFAVVGKLMQGEPAPISPDAAEKVANFFKVNVVDLYFDESNLSKENDKKADHLSKSKTGENKSFFEDDTFFEGDTETGHHLRPFFDVIFDPPHSYHPVVMLNCYGLCSDEALDKFIRSFISIEEERCGPGDLDYSRIYKIIAELIAQNPQNFKEKYLRQKNQMAALEILRSYVKEKF